MANSSLTRDNCPPIPAIPTFRFQGRQRPEDFSHGAMAVVSLLQDMDARTGEECHIVMQEAFPRLLPHVTRGGEYGIGALAALFDYAVECTLGGGIPDLSVWVPFSRCWEGDNSEIPPDDCMFFEARGVPYSVEPNLHTLRWHGKESATAEPVESIRDVARPIPREEFELLRGSPVAAAKADAKLQAFMASLGMSRADR